MEKQENINSFVDYYNKKAGLYDELRLTYENPNLYKRFFYLTRFNSVVSSLSPQKGERVLDVGCGPGFYTRYLVNSGCQVTAIDFSKEYIKQAKSYVGNKAKFIVADATSLPFKNNYFDKLLLSEIIEHVQDYKSVLSESARVLRPNGIAVVTTPNKLSYMNFAYKLKRVLKKYKYNEHVIEFSPRQFTNIIAEYFVIEKINFSNFLIPYPLDELFLEVHSARTINLLKRIENLLQNTALIRNIGWTMIFQVKKPK